MRKVSISLVNHISHLRHFLKFDVIGKDYQILLYGVCSTIFPLRKRVCSSGMGSGAKNTQEFISKLMSLALPRLCSMLCHKHEHEKVLPESCKMTVPPPTSYGALCKVRVGVPEEQVQVP